MMVPQFLVLACFAVVVCLFLLCGGLFLRGVSGRELVMSKLF
uniref:ATP synthase F0 subunit 8 n=1 Tax=Bathymodiolus securiformis TaxID=268470 RepID=A0A384W1V4_9BIVA|nr:ATP synthase F0 subunit 8 [Bathymodiolus securiformis]ATB19136.1 ATP synthase F0 subunit 8 [Bathymodiolus securiformis]